MENETIRKAIDDAIANVARRLPEIARKALDALLTEEVWGENVETKQLKCGLKIAMEDYCEINADGNKKTKFTFNEALEIEKKTNGKWRVPTVAEWMQIVLELGTTEDGNLDREKLVKELNLTEDDDGYGYYWSSTSGSSTGAYSLYFRSSGVNPANDDLRGFGYSVRCVSL